MKPQGSEKALRTVPEDRHEWYASELVRVRFASRSFSSKEPLTASPSR